MKISIVFAFAIFSFSATSGELKIPTLFVRGETGLRILSDRAEINFDGYKVPGDIDTLYASLHLTCKEGRIISSINFYKNYAPKTKMTLVVKNTTQDSFVYLPASDQESVDIVHKTAGDSYISNMKYNNRGKLYIDNIKNESMSNGMIKHLYYINPSEANWSPPDVSVAFKISTSGNQVYHHIEDDYDRFYSYCRNVINR